MTDEDHDRIVEEYTRAGLKVGASSECVHAELEKEFPGEFLINEFLWLDQVITKLR